MLNKAKIWKSCTNIEISVWQPEQQISYYYLNIILDLLIINQTERFRLTSSLMLLTDPFMALKVVLLISVWNL